MGHSINHSRYSHDASYTVYLGDDGRREAVLQFLDYTLTLPQGQQLWFDEPGRYGMANRR